MRWRASDGHARAFGFESRNDTSTTNATRSPPMAPSTAAVHVQPRGIVPVTKNQRNPGAHDEADKAPEGLCHHSTRRSP